MKFEANTPDATSELELERGPDGSYLFRLGETSYKAELISNQGNWWTLKIGHKIENFLIEEHGDHLLITWKQRTLPVQIYGIKEKFRRSAALAEEGTAVFKAEMPGRVVRVLKREGDKVAAGEGVVVIEAMKMQNEVRASKDGVVSKMAVEEGQPVEAAELLFQID